MDAHEKTPEENVEYLEGAIKESRRSLLIKAGVALNVITGTLLALPLVGYAISVVLKKKEYRAWISLGATDKFPQKETRLATYKNPTSRPWDGPAADVPCWVRRQDEKTFQVFAINCTHLGCPVRWFRESELFMCPCHGGVYYADGERAAGPPPRGLFKYEMKLEKGQLWIRAGELPNLSTKA